MIRHQFNLVFWWVALRMKGYAAPTLQTARPARAPLIFVNGGHQGKINGVRSLRFSQDDGYVKPLPNNKSLRMTV